MNNTRTKEREREYIWVAGGEKASQHLCSPVDMLAVTHSMQVQLPAGHSDLGLISSPVYLTFNSGLIRTLRSQISVLSSEVQRGMVDKQAWLCAYLNVLQYNNHAAIYYMPQTKDYNISLPLGKWKLSALLDGWNTLHILHWMKGKRIFIRTEYPVKETRGSLDSAFHHWM